jgi:MSHA biogenesis protein MshN
MSIINKMLQELDKRHALSEPRAAPAPEYGGLAQQARPAEDSTLASKMFWRSLAGIILVVLAWVIWVMWQIVPRPLVTGQAYQSLSQVRSPAQPAPVAASASAGPAPKAEAARPEGAKAEAAKPDAAKTEPFDMLRLATEIVTPIRGGTPGPTPPAGLGERDRVAGARPPVRGKAEPTAPGVATKTGTAVPPQRTIVGTAAVAPDAGRIDKRIDATPREGAEAEFRRAMALVNQGRMAEGVEGLRTALSLDPAYDTARQTLVALLLESKRTDEAASLLQQALALNPANTGNAMLLARIQVENGDPQRALALLQKYEAAGQSNAEYHAFVAALYQRLGRHAEAVDQYQGALRLTAGVGAWWVGLGISQEALEHRRDAVDAFSRAKATGNLNGDLLVYVDRRLKQLQ